MPSLLYAEVLLIPEFTQPSLSAEAVRQNDGAPLPREPLLPSSFTIQLYNPDQQVTIQYKPKTWNSPPMWTFEMPMLSFRQPSSSRLDRTQSDPAAVEFTPKLKFSWRRDGKLSKDLTCLLTGMTTFLPETKAKRKEADIPIAMFQSHREITLYEPNLYRVEMEDFKGLELVIILGAIVIRDVYSGMLKDTFNVSEPTTPQLTRPHSILPVAPPKPPRPSRTSPLNSPVTASGALGAARPIPGAFPQANPQSSGASSPRMERDTEESRRTRAFLEAEERARRRRQAEVDRETERLQRVYGEEERMAREQRQQSIAAVNRRPHPSTYGRYPHSNHSTTQLVQVPYMQAPTYVADPRPQRSSFFGLRRPVSDNRVMKKQSSIF